MELNRDLLARTEAWGWKKFDEALAASKAIRERIYATTTTGVAGDGDTLHGVTISVKLPQRYRRQAGTDLHDEAFRA